MDQRFEDTVVASSRDAAAPEHRFELVIRKEFDEINKCETANERAEEWVDVAILALDGLLRATREALRESGDGREGVQVDQNNQVLGFNGEPTNDLVANVAANMIRTKQMKNELRDFGDWRNASEDEAIEHKRGVHD